MRETLIKALEYLWQINNHQWPRLSQNQSHTIVVVPLPHMALLPMSLPVSLLITPRSIGRKSQAHIDRVQKVAYKKVQPDAAQGASEQSGFLHA